MWARALAAARREGWEPAVRARGAVFGPHDADVIAFDDLALTGTSGEDGQTETVTLENTREFEERLKALLERGG